MSDTAIQVEQLGKLYRIGAQKAKYKTFRDTLAHAAAAPARMARSLFSRNGRAKPDDNTFWALKDISFEVKRGDVVGIIGRNGAGKSTLLKILSRITDPTTGFAEIHGRVGSLLEVGTGFHPELTGRENIYLNGAILGMSKADIERRFDEMVAFAEVEKFIDTPVKHYSSGMYLRLAFAVAAHLEPEILLVDEVLAVGDAQFQKKCLGKMGEVADQGRTVLFVSHNLAAISQLCTISILLKDGSLAYVGETSACINMYLREIESDANAVLELSSTGNGQVKEAGELTKIEIRDKNGLLSTTFGIGEPFEIKLTMSLNKPARNIALGIEVASGTGIPLLNLRSDSQQLNFGPYSAGNVVCFIVVVPGLPFYPGIYRISPWLAIQGGNRFAYLKDAITITVDSRGTYRSEGMIQEGRGIVIMDCEITDSLVST